MKGWTIRIAGWFCFVLSFILLGYAGLLADKVFNNISISLIFRIINIVICIAGGLALYFLLAIAGEWLVNKANQIEHKKEQDILIARMGAFFNKYNKNKKT